VKEYGQGDKFFKCKTLVGKTAELIGELIDRVKV
jgi:hypothetical protein